MEIKSELILLIIFFIILGVLLCEFLKNPEYNKVKNKKNNVNKNK
jgi:hypothetical protein